MYYTGQQHHQHALHSSHPHHSGRSRRAARASGSQHNNHQKQMRALRIQKEAEESALEKAYRRDFEAARSFDLDDDELFCPFHLLTEDDVRTSLPLYARPPFVYMMAPGSPLASTLFWLELAYVTDYFQLQSMHSSGSDRSSLSSGSPEQSPLQHQLQPTSQFLLPPSSGTFTPQSFQQPATATSQPTKIHQPLAQRARNAIPIVDPTTRAVASPPPSVSPARQIQAQYMNTRRW